MFSHAYDIFVFALALGIPAYVIFRVEQLWAAIPLAAIIAWLSIYFGGRVLAAAHPVQHPHISTRFGSEPVGSQAWFTRYSCSAFGCSFVTCENAMPRSNHAMERIPQSRDRSSCSR